MNKITVVELPELVSTDDAERDAEIRSWLLANKEKWADALDRDTSYINARASHMGDEIDEIEVVDGDIKVDYSVRYYIYNGCANMDEDDEDERVIGGKFSDGKISFETPPPPAPRYPNEEL